MRLMAEDWAREAIQELRAATEWPHNAKFFYVESADAIAIGPGRVWHMDLLNRLKSECGPLVIDEDHRGYEGYVGGHIEWESDGTFVCRNESGERLSEKLLLELTQVLSALGKRTP